MNLSDAQLEAVKNGEAVRVDADNIEMVVIRSELFYRLDHTQEQPRSSYAAVLKVLDQADEDPGQYLDYVN
ncbi:hypothetical protein [Planctomicrobium piriforme]|uniref:Uncharacterized protein n=1 Tax=Planctomicrobium piriforme TaxID=1576369 RepID=A0A1I3R250_9PLAN|nr:hypothetical protein [Planctomicrobium piriforme]SFJ39326.1 hypothetical protein SAMN05421753_119106 [Planctomicrobium piriforme]